MPFFDLLVHGSWRWISFFNRKNKTSKSYNKQTMLSTNSANPRWKYRFLFYFVALVAATAAPTPSTSCADFTNLAWCRFPLALYVPSVSLMGWNLFSSHLYLVYARKQQFVFSRIYDSNDKSKATLAGCMPTASLSGTIHMFFKQPPTSYCLIHASR